MQKVNRKLVYCPECGVVYDWITVCDEAVKEEDGMADDNFTEYLMPCNHYLSGAVSLN